MKIIDRETMNCLHLPTVPSIVRCSSRRNKPHSSPSNSFALFTITFRFCHRLKIYHYCSTVIYYIYYSFEGVIKSNSRLHPEIKSQIDNHFFLNDRRNHRVATLLTGVTPVGTVLVAITVFSGIGQMA